MSWLMHLPVLLAQAEAQAAATSWYLNPWAMILIVLAVLVLPNLAGNYLGGRLKMPDHRWKISLMLGALAAGIVVVSLGEVKLGIELRGGTNLIYEVDTESQRSAGLQEAQTKILAEYRKEDNDLIVGSPDENIKITVPDNQRELLAKIREELPKLEIQGGSLELVPDDIAREGDRRALECELRVVEQKSIQMDKMIGALSRRINPAGVKEIIIRPAGFDRVEIIIPENDPAEVEAIKMRLQTAGILEFRILANRNDPAHEDIIRRATSAQADQEKRREVRRGLRTVARWVDFKQPTSGDDDREPGTIRFDPQQTGGRVARELDGGQWQMLVIVDQYDVNGGYLSSARSGFDRSARPAINFTFGAAGATRFGELTGKHVPNQGLESLLGIVLDNQLLSAAVIQSRITDSGEITGNFNQQYVDYVVDVLNAGSLPTSLHHEPVSEERMSSIIGEDLIHRGELAIGISFAGVLAFMLVYYRFSGVVASIALVMNLILVLAVMIVVRAAFSLAGLAGLVLTVGMAVDANVLIFERIREELDRGSALRMAIRNGFSRATRTIVDANLTTLITAVVLYAIGKDQIKGFAVTLFLGIVMSMFTAIFCSRIIYDIAEKRRWITELRMMRLLGRTNFDFLGRRRVAAFCSITLIVIGLCGVVARGRGLLDIDFTGGVSVNVLLKQSMPIAEVRRMVELRDENGDPLLPDSTVASVGSGDNQYKIDTSIHDQSGERGVARAKVREIIMSIFEGRLETYSMTFDPPREVRPKPEVPEALLPDAPVLPPLPKSDESTGDATPPAKPAEKSPGPESAKPKSPSPEKPDDAPPKLPPVEPPAGDGASADLLPETLIASNGDLSWLLAQAAPPIDKKTDNKDAGETPPVTTAKQPAQADAAGAADAAGEPIPDPPAIEPPAEFGFDPLKGDPSFDAPPTIPDLQVRLHFPKDVPINHPTLEALLQAAMKAAVSAGTAQQGTIRIFNEQRPETSNSTASFTQWDVVFESLSQQQAEDILKRVQDNLVHTPHFPSSSLIGSRVAGDTQNKAIQAMLFSLAAIVAYIWVRFQKVMYGLAAVVALVHDVLVTLGVIALSAYVAPYLGFLQVESFKISLAVLAAFMTIIGYSLNDTIVVFDRIREVRGKSPQLTDDMINASINQTLSRTLLTSMTTLIVVVILYFIGGQGIHAFAFSLIIGVAVGTYSSIFVASPALRWMAQSSAAAQQQPSSTSETLQVGG